METITCDIVETFLSHVSPFAPDHVPSSDKHTLPSLYRFGFMRARPPPVVLNRTFGAHAGYALGKNASKRKTRNRTASPPVPSRRRTKGRPGARPRARARCCFG